MASRQPVDEVPPYARLLQSAMAGDPSLFSRADSVEAQWQIVEPVLGNATPLSFYEPGSWGPREADRLFARGGRVAQSLIRPRNSDRTYEHDRSDPRTS